MTGSVVPVKEFILSNYVTEVQFSFLLHISKPNFLSFSLSFPVWSSKKYILQLFLSYQDQCKITEHAVNMGMMLSKIFFFHNADKFCCK